MRRIYDNPQNGVPGRACPHGYSVDAIVRGPYKLWTKRQLCHHFPERLQVKEVPSPWFKTERRMGLRWGREAEATGIRAWIKQGVTMVTTVSTERLVDAEMFEALMAALGDIPNAAGLVEQAEKELMADKAT